MKKYFDRPPSTMGDWLVLAAGTALLFAAVARLPAALMALGGLLALLGTLRLGAGAGLRARHSYALFCTKTVWRAAWLGAGGQLRAVLRRAGIAGGVGRAPAGAKHHRLCRTVGRL